LNDWNLGNSNKRGSMIFHLSNLNISHIPIYSLINIFQIFFKSCPILIIYPQPLTLHWSIANRHSKASIKPNPSMPTTLPKLLGTEQRFATLKDHMNRPLCFTLFSEPFRKPQPIKWKSWPKVTASQRSN